MLVMVAGAVSFFAAKKTGELMDLGVRVHRQCAIAAATNRESLTQPLAPMLLPLLNTAEAGKAKLPPDVSDHRCTVDGREFIHAIFHKNGTAVSAILTRQREQELFPRALANRTGSVAGIELHEAVRQGYSVAAFEAGGWLGYVVSALPDWQNAELARRLVPVMSHYSPN